jgi:hypothetical protein
MKSGLEITPYFAFFWDMGRHSKAAKKKHHEIAQARTCRSTTRTLPGSTREVNKQEEPTPPIVSEEEQELNNSASEPGDQWGEDTGWDTEEEYDGLVGDEDEELSELEGEELCESLKIRVEGEMKELANAEQASQTAYAAIMQELSAKDWRKLEAQRGLGYNGQAERTKRRHRQIAREEEEKNKKLRNS